MFALLAFEYAKWHFVVMPLEILKAWRNILVFCLTYFSLPVLVQTLFSPWRRVEWQSEKRFDIGLLLQNMFGNLVSRVLGACIRIWIILLGLIAVLAALAAGIAIFVSWFLVPCAIVALFFYGLFLFL